MFKRHSGLKKIKTKRRDKFPLFIMNRTQAEKTFVEQHNHARQIFTALISWWTYWTVVNFATMGWLAGSIKSGSAPSFITAVAWLFVAQNILGGVACAFTYRTLRRIHKLAQDAGSFIGTDSPEPIPEHSGTPICIYRATIALMLVVLCLFCVVWIVAPRCLTTSANPSRVASSLPAQPEPLKITTNPPTSPPLKP